MGKVFVGFMTLVTGFMVVSGAFLGNKILMILGLSLMCLVMGWLIKTIKKLRIQIGIGAKYNEECEKEVVDYTKLLKNVKEEIFLMAVIILAEHLGIIANLIVRLTTMRV